jgi:nitroimidazol reductase NimA-like FMN-containing flavoprotein (pyridoxamine 5'-phosphate oxidase superfamily)
MIEILEMHDGEIGDMLRRVKYGHLACSRDNQPYVVPIYFVYDGNEIFMYTTAGLKSQVMEDNPKICLQAEELEENGAWRSVVVIGEAYKIVDRSERERAVDLVRSANPMLLPALAIKWSSDWMRKNVEVVYKIKILKTTGRFTSEIRIASAAARPHLCDGPQCN